MSEGLLFAKALLQQLQAHKGARQHILYVHSSPATRATFSSLSLPGQDMFEHLYSHQGEVLEHAQQQKHVVVATATASGKTFATVLPYLVTLQQDPQACLLCIAPTRALVEQWCDRLAQWCSGLSVAAFTGDTPEQKKETIRRNAHVIVTTPDKFHVSMLPYHHGWRSFYQRLSYIILDESHTYRGVFGSHMAHILLRFKRVAAHYRSSPTLLFASATIGNPQEHTESLFGQTIEPITQSGAPTGGRLFVLWQPTNTFFHSEDATKLMAFFVKRGIRTLLFGQQRQSVERMAKRVCDWLPKQLHSQVAAYRSGYHPQQRKRIHHALMRGELTGVVSTNALELGIDIGDLDVVIMDGFPGSVASLWQQAGRAGRGKKAALVILVLRENALDQYFSTQPQRLFQARAENALINTKNPYILRIHLHCAAKEFPLSQQDIEAFGSDAVKYAEDLVRDGLFVKEGNTYRLKDQRSSPAYGESIRNIGRPLTIVDECNNEVEEALDLPHAVTECHPGAIYLSRGEMYHVKALDLRAGQIHVQRCEVNYYTEPLVNVEIALTRTYPETKAFPHVVVHVGEVEVQRTVYGYLRKHMQSHTTLGIEELEEPLPLSLPTQACWVTVDESLMNELVGKQYDPLGCLHAVEHAMIAFLPLFILGDARDMGGLSEKTHFQTKQATFFLYDGYPGGIGHAQEAFYLFRELAQATLEGLLHCPCEAGCYACVQTPQCGSKNQHLDKAGAIYFLQTLLGTGQRESQAEERNVFHKEKKSV